MLLQDHCLLEIQGRGEHTQGIQAQPADRHRIQGPSFNPELLLQIHLLQKGRTDVPTFSKIKLGQFHLKFSSMALMFIQLK